MLPQLFGRSPGYHLSPIILVQFAFVAGSTHLLALVNAENHRAAKKATEARKAVALCKSILNGLGQSCKTGLLCADIILKLESEWCQPVEDFSGAFNNAESQVASAVKIEETSPVAEDRFDYSAFLPKASPSNDVKLDVSAQSFAKQHSSGTDVPEHAPAFASAYSAQISALRASTLPTHGPTLPTANPWPFFAPWAALPVGTVSPPERQRPLDNRTSVGYTVPLAESSTFRQVQQPLRTFVPTSTFSLSSFAFAPNTAPAEPPTQIPFAQYPQAKQPDATLTDSSAVLRKPSPDANTQVDPQRLEDYDWTGWLSDYRYVQAPEQHHAGLTPTGGVDDLMTFTSSSMLPAMPAHGWLDNSFIDFMQSHNQ